MSWTSRVLRSLVSATSWESRRSKSVGKCSRRVLLAVLTGLLLMSGWPEPAIAQSCRTPQVEARINELGQRIERYRDRINRSKQELSKLNAELNEFGIVPEFARSERTRAKLRDLSYRISQISESIEFQEATLKRLVEERNKLESLPACPRPAPSVSAAPRASSEAAALAKALPGGRCAGAVAGAELRQRDPDPGVMLALIMACQWLRGGNPR
jgi:septal ring factor EnvC (AmiA/AmiB activator)